MAQCMTPFEVQIETNRHTVPCGKCPACYARRISHWSFRLMEEDKISSSSLFLTLTYNTDHVPINAEGWMTLQKRDLQLYFKRLRKANSQKLKYFAVGEYGGKTERPHYHIILFNAKEKTIQHAWRKNEQQIGEIHFGKVSEASVGYTLKYMAKLGKIPKHAKDTRQKEFQIMSKGLGQTYIKKLRDWHHADIEQRMYCNLKDGKKISMPRYYKDKIYNTEQRGKLKAYHTQKIQDEKTALEQNPELLTIIQQRNASFEVEFKKLKVSQNQRKN